MTRNEDLIAEVNGLIDSLDEHVTHDDIARALATFRDGPLADRLAALTTPQEGTARTEMSKSSVVAYHEWRTAYGLDRLSDDEGTAARIAFYAGWDWALTTSPDAAAEATEQVGEDRAYLYQLSLKLGQERDAATAAIERVRAAVAKGSLMDPTPTRMEPDTAHESESWWQSYHLRANEAWRDNILAALDGAPEPEWEFMVRSRFASHEHVLDSQWMDEETARAIFEWEDPDITRTLFMRRKAGPLILVGGDDVQA